MMFPCGGSWKANPETDEYETRWIGTTTAICLSVYPDLAIEEPSPHLMPLFYKEDEGGIQSICVLPT